MSMATETSLKMRCAIWRGAFLSLMSGPALKRVKPTWWGKPRNDFTGRTAEPVDVFANFTEDLTDDDRALLMRNAIAMAAERLSDLVGDLAEDLADKYL
jgi:hypothetical protein